jgi:hypothetical protein
MADRFGSSGTAGGAADDLQSVELIAHRVLDEAMLPRQRGGQDREIERGEVGNGFVEV